MPVVLFVTGIAVWVNGMYFLGIGARPQEGQPDPLKAVGWVTLVAGLSDFAMLAFVLGRDPDLGRLSGLVAFYAAFFTWLGIVEILGLDLRVIGNLSIPVALVPLVYWYNFFGPDGVGLGDWMWRSILIVWAVVFLAIAATTYGRMRGQTLGMLLILTAGYTFFVPASYLALGFNFP